MKFIQREINEPKTEKPNQTNSEQIGMNNDLKPMQCELLECSKPGKMKHPMKTRKINTNIPFA